jgi:hypothetical protein
MPGHRFEEKREDTDMLNYEKHLMVVPIVAAVVLAATILARIFDIPLPFVPE